MLIRYVTHDVMSHLLWHQSVDSSSMLIFSIQTKCADLDSRLLALSKDQQVLQQKIAALQLSADKVNPNKPRTLFGEQILPQ